MKVSIVTPSLDQGAFIERTLASVAAQNFVDLEHLVFDGGSSDQTIGLLARSGPAVRWVSRRDGGQADAVNQGLREAGGELIGWLNSDDVYYPGAIDHVVRFMDAHPDIDVVYGMADHIDVDDRVIEPYPVAPWDFERLKDFCFICQPALFLRRRVIEAHGLLRADLKFCMDYEYWLRLGEARVRFAYLPRKLAGSRMYASNKTLGSRVAVHREINRMMRDLFGRVPDRWLVNHAHAVVERHVRRETHPTWFVLALAAVSLAGAVRWNHAISRAMMSRPLRRMRRAR